MEHYIIMFNYLEHKIFIKNNIYKYVIFKRKISKFISDQYLINMMKNYFSKILNTQ